MQPVKAQFSDFVEFTINVEDRIIDFQIQKVYTKKLLIQFGDLIQTIYDSDAETIEEFAVESPELAIFYRDYILEYWILLAYRRFISKIGLNVGQFGLTRIADPEGTFTQATDDDKAVIIRQESSDINVCETNIYKRLKAVKWTFDGTVFVNPDPDNLKTPPKKSFGIRPIGGGKPKDDCGYLGDIR